MFDYCTKIETRNRCKACVSNGRYSINRSDRVCRRAMYIGCAETKFGGKLYLGYCLEHRDIYVIKNRKDPECEMLQTFNPDYCGYFILSTVSGVGVTKSKHIRHKLFMRRYKECIKSKSDRNMAILKRGYESMWSDLKKASKRNTRGREKCGRPKSDTKRDIVAITVF